MLKSALCILVLAASCGLLAQAPQQSDEESLRTMYYKHAYLVGMTPVVDAALAAHAGQPVDKQELGRKLDNSKLEVTLSNIKTGPIQEILSAPWSSVSDTPWAPTETLQINVGQHDFQDVDQPQVSWQVATAKWVTADPKPPPSLLDALLRMPVKEALDEEQERLKSGPWTRYATYTVTLKFQGKSETYKAVCFFRNDNGTVKALPEDTFFQSNTLMTGASQNFFPATLLGTNLREYAPLKEWFRGHTVTDQNCHTGGTGFCCAGNSCGVASADLERELAKPIAGRKP